MESKLKLSNIVAFCTFLACCLAFGTVLWKGGAVERQVQVNTARIDKLEQLSSTLARVEAKLDGLKESLDEHKKGKQ